MRSSAMVPACLRDTEFAAKSIIFGAFASNLIYLRKILLNLVRDALTSMYWDLYRIPQIFLEDFFPVPAIVPVVPLFVEV
jgi:hypothetical protein